MRGKARAASQPWHRAGITPAHAGKSSPACASPPAGRDHPRTCGEKVAPSACDGITAGSPPHMRGKEARPGKRYDRAGITPAHAGKSQSTPRTCLPIRDHPRTCGEKFLSILKWGLRRGSPPHMRGKDGHGINALGGAGITPAHAGKRGAGMPTVFAHGDHPRTCGEKFPQHQLFQCHAGSPPHMRGKAYNLQTSGAFAGITPAHAGKSSMFITYHTSFRDHPRTCGEKFPPIFLKPQQSGSPPHMRGKVSNACKCLNSVGITPAHAGKRCYPYPGQ